MEILTSRILLEPTDLERSQRFYEHTLGLAIYREWRVGETRGIAFLLGGGGILEVSGHSDERPSKSVKLVLQVRDLDSTHATLSERGVEIPAPPELKPWGLEEMTALDPDGIELIFVEIPAGHPRRSG